MIWFIKYLLITTLVIWFLVLMSCSTKSISCIDDEEYLLHHCPEDGHGDCPICCDPQLKNHEMAHKN